MSEREKKRQEQGQRGVQNLLLILKFYRLPFLEFLFASLCHAPFKTYITRACDGRGVLDVNTREESTRVQKHSIFQFTALLRYSSFG